MKEKEELRKKLLREGFDCYTFYLVAGNEDLICSKLNRKYPGAYFLTLRKMMHKSKDGLKYDVESTLLEKHIFLYVKKDECIDFMHDLNGLLYLNDNGNDGKLVGSDFEYAKWVLEIDGLIKMSTATLEEGPIVNEQPMKMVKITGGPLLMFKDSILKYSRRNRNCLVSLNIAGIKLETWLPFEWEIELPA